MESANEKNPEHSEFLNNQARTLLTVLALLIPEVKKVLAEGGDKKKVLLYLTESHLNDASVYGFENARSIFMAGKPPAYVPSSDKRLRALVDEVCSN